MGYSSKRRNGPNFDRYSLLIQTKALADFILPREVLGGVATCEPQSLGKGSRRGSDFRLENGLLVPSERALLCSYRLSRANL